MDGWMDGWMGGYKHYGRMDGFFGFWLLFSVSPFIHLIEPLSPAL